MAETVTLAGVGTFRWLRHLGLWEGEEPVEGLMLTLSCPTADAAQAMRPHVHAALGRRAALEPLARARLQLLHGASDDDMAALRLTGLQLEGSEVTLVFDLPPGSPVEYLTVSFGAGEQPLRTGGGNY